LEFVFVFVHNLYKFEKGNDLETRKKTWPMKIGLRDSLTLTSMPRAIGLFRLDTSVESRWYAAEICQISYYV